MAAQILGRRVHHDVSPQGQRTRQARGGVGVVDHDLGAGAMGDPRDRRDVDQTHVRIGRGLEVDDPGLLRDDGRQGFGPGHVDLLHRHAEPGQAIAQESEGAAIQGLVGDHLIAGAQETPQGGGDRAHSGGRGDRRLGAFQAGEATLQKVRRGVGDARVEMPLAGPGEHLAARFGALEGEGRGQVQRRGQRAVLVGGVIARVDRPRGKAGLVIAHMLLPLTPLWRGARRLRLRSLL